uniref:Uncharacterized protein n=1 Tax=Tanacetum cinerariifolium TaxID=118510 RepID=A0A6L2LTB9_TANCI|nr:hypothetical protein [Tanacetum cinerariifolium]
MLFDVVDDLRGEEVFVSQEVHLKEVNVVAATTTNAIIDDITLDKALMEIKSAKTKADKVVIQEPEQGTTTTTLTTTVATTITAASTRPKAKGLVIHEQELAPTSIVSSQQPSQVKVQDKGKGKMFEPEPIDADYQLAQRLQAEEQEKLTDEEKARLFVKFLKKRRKFFAAKRSEEKRNKPPTRAQQRREVTEGSSKRAGEEIKQENAKKQKMEDDKESTELKQCLEIIPEDGDDVTIDATPVSSKSPTIVDYKINKEGKNNYF